MNDELASSGVQETRKTITAAAELVKFTIDELAEYAGVPRATVQSVISRNPDLFVELGIRRTERRGGQPMDYAVDREVVKRYFASARPTGAVAVRLQLVYQHLLWDVPVAKRRRAKQMIETARLACRQLAAESIHVEVIGRLIELAEQEENEDLRIDEAIELCRRLEDDAEKLLELEEAHLSAGIYRRVARSALQVMIRRAAERRDETGDVDIPYDALGLRARALERRLFEPRKGAGAAQEPS